MRITRYAYAFTSTQRNLAEDQEMSVSQAAAYNCATRQEIGAFKRVMAVRYGAAHLFQFVADG